MKTRNGKGTRVKLFRYPNMKNLGNNSYKSFYLSHVQRRRRCSPKVEWYETPTLTTLQDIMYIASIHDDVGYKRLLCYGGSGVDIS